MQKDGEETQLLNAEFDSDTSEGSLKVRFVFNFNE